LHGACKYFYAVHSRGAVIPGIHVQSCVGTSVANSMAMNILSRPLPAALSKRAHASCPSCGTPTAPAAESTSVMAWYECRCGDQWECRLRNGVPDAPLVGAFALMSRQLLRVA
jgi:hypothetical protein